MPDAHVPDLPVADPAASQVAFCSSCGQAVTAGHRFCSGCGSPLDASQDPAPRQDAPPPRQDPAPRQDAPPPQPMTVTPQVDADYSDSSKLAAGVLTLVAPFISLLAALMMRGSQSNPIRRASLRTWAIASGVWLAFGLVIGIIIIGSLANSSPHHAPTTSGPCDGGPVLGASGVDVGHGNVRFPCTFGGSTVVHLGN